MKAHLLIISLSLVLLLAGCFSLSDMWKPIITAVPTVVVPEEIVGEHRAKNIPYVTIECPYCGEKLMVDFPKETISSWWQDFLLTCFKWLVGFCVALIALTYLFPTLGVKIMMFLFGRFRRSVEAIAQAAADKAHESFEEVVKGIEEAKAQLPDASVAILKNNLSKKMDKVTKQKVKTIIATVSTDAK